MATAEVKNQCQHGHLNSEKESFKMKSEIYLKPVANLSKILAMALIAVPLFYSNAGAADKLRLTVPVKAVSFAPLYLAVDGGYFKKHGVDLEVIVVRGGPAAVASLLGGDVQFVSVADDEVLKVAKSNKVIRVYNYNNSFTQNLQVSNAFLKARKITLDMPWKERVKRMKGMIMGVIVPGGSSDLAGRWMFKQAGLHPTNDMKILRIGGLPSLLSAMRGGNIDGFVLSPPAGPIVEAGGFGKIAVPYSDIAEFHNEPFLGIDTLNTYMRDHRDIVARVVTAVAEAQAAIHKDPASAAKTLRTGSFASISQAILERSLSLMQDAFRPTKMSNDGWNFVKAMRIAVGRAEFADLNVTEGVHWTNEFSPK